MSYKIAIVEDDGMISALLKEHLERYGFEPFVCTQMEQIDEEIGEIQPHLVLMDINLPKYDGFFWCKKLRRKSKMPILFLSAREMDLDQIYAMECGGDDYLTKPFSCELLTAKINAQIRRCYGEYALAAQEETEISGLQLLAAEMKLQYGDRKVCLSKNEKDIFICLFRSYPGAAEREELLKQLWDTELFVEENTLNVNMARARKRLAETGAPFEIKAVRGVGYALEETGK